jgi:hypothetical protein
LVQKYGQSGSPESAKTEVLNKFRVSKVIQDYFSSKSSEELSCKHYAETQVGDRSRRNRKRNRIATEIFFKF